MIAVELGQQTRRSWTWATLAAIAAVPVLLTLVIGLSRPTLPERVGDWDSVVTSSSGLTIPLIALSAMLLFVLPLGAAVFAGCAVAGDAASGSLRSLLVRPVSRSRVLVSKAAVAAGFTVVAVVATVAVSIVAGLIAFGWHSLSVLDLQHSSAFGLAQTSFSPAAAMLRIALACGVILLTLVGPFCFTLLLSTLSGSPAAAVAGGVGFSVVSRALDNVPGLAALGPLLPVTNAQSIVWTGLFVDPIDLGGVGHLALVQGAYAAIFLGAAWWRFSRADILC